MDSKTFNGLKFGNVIEGPSGEKRIVTQVIRDANGNVSFIGTMPAMSFGDVQGSWKVVSASTIQTSLVGTTIHPAPPTNG